MAHAARITRIETPESAPRYELRVRRHGPADTEYAIWQMPAAATPSVTSALRIARLRGPIWTSSSTACCAGLRNPG